MVAGSDQAKLQLVERFMGTWLKSTLNECRFATKAVATDRVLLGVRYGLPNADFALDLDTLLRSAAEKDKVGLAVYPDLRTESHLAALLLALLRSESWYYEERMDPEGAQDRVHVDLRWRKEDGKECSAIGFAPLGVMPLTRRAPLFAMAVWPVGFTNPRRRKPDDFIGVGDMSHKFRRPTYDADLRETRERVQGIRDILGDSSIITGLTFSLSAEWRPVLFAHEGPGP